MTQTQKNDATQPAQKGDTVSFHFTGTLEDGTMFASSNGQEPMTITLGEGNILPDIDTALTGMNPGDSTELKIDSNDAYGPHRPELIYDVERDKFPAQIELQKGMALEASRPDGQPFMITVVELSEETVTVDENHPLAGKDLNFQIELVDIQKAA